MATLSGQGMRARNAITSNNAASSAYAIARPRISFCSSMFQSATFAEPTTQGLQQRLLVKVDVDDAAAGVNRKADGGAFGARAFHHHRGVMDDLNRWIKFLDLHRNRHGVAAHRNKMIDVDGILASDDAADADRFLADRRQHLAPVDQNEIIGAAAIVTIEQHES